MFSQRSSWHTSPLSLSALAGSMRDSGTPVLDLAESNPTACGLLAPEDLLAASPSPRDIQQYHPDPRGWVGARKAVARLYREVGATIDPDHVLLTSGTSEAYSFLLRLLCNPGENILVPRPSYPLFDLIADLNDVELRAYDLHHGGEWIVDMESVRRQTDGSTRAIVLVHPNNPTGSYVKDNERAELEQWAAEKRMALMVDEVFWWYPLRDGNARPASFVSAERCLTFSLNGISKFLGLPQMKLAWMVVSGPSDLRRAAIERLDIITDTYLSVGTPVQRALPALLKQRAQLHGPIRERVRGNLDVLRKLVTGMPELTLLDPEGGWSAVLRLPNVKSDNEWAEELLRRRGVLVHPGHFYGFMAGSYVIVSLLVEAHTFSDGIREIGKAMTEHQGVHLE